MRAGEIDSEAELLSVDSEIEDSSSFVQVTPEAEDASSFVQLEKKALVKESAKLGVRPVDGKCKRRGDSDKF